MKTLFAISANLCTYEGCEEKLTDPLWRQVNAEVAHICGEKPGAARYDETMTDDERGRFDNLILLCPNHHKLIDRLEPENYPPERLRKMRDRHHQSFDGTAWATETQLDMFVRMVLTGQPRSRPYLVLSQQGTMVQLVNHGDAPAYGIRVRAGEQPIDRHWIIPAAIVPQSIPPGESWVAGQSVAENMLGEGPFAVIFSWQDDTGEQYRTTAELSSWLSG